MTREIMSYKNEEESFSSFLDDVTVKGAIGMGIGLGSKLKIFELMASLGPTTYTEIAETGRWKSRYIKEWLNLMVSGHIVEYIADQEHYYIPEDRKKYLLHSGKTENKSILLQGLNVCGLVSTELASCFALDGPNGVPYSSYTFYHEWRSERIQAGFHWAGRLGLKNILRLIPNVLEKLEQGAKVCDGGCGSGQQAMLLAENLPNSTFTGFDISEKCMGIAHEILQKKQLSNITFHVQDACNMPSDWSDSFDVFTVFDVVHDVPQPMEMLQEVYRVLKPGGAFLMMDINVHTPVEENCAVRSSPVVYFLSLFHCMPVSLHAENGAGLGSAWGIETQKAYLAQAGFNNIKQLAAEDKFHSYFIAYK